jgi:hypothetical protein
MKISIPCGGQQVEEKELGINPSQKSVPIEVCPFWARAPEGRTNATPSSKQRNAAKENFLVDSFMGIDKF